MLSKYRIIMDTSTVVSFLAEQLVLSIKTFHEGIRFKQVNYLHDAMQFSDHTI